MKERNCFVLILNQKSSKFNDFIGKFYHFPKKYHKRLSKQNIEFVYFDPTINKIGCYFGYGRIARVFEDERESGYYFAEIKDFKKFSQPVPAKAAKVKPRNAQSEDNESGDVRPIDSETLEGICLDGGILLNFKSDAHLVRVLGEQLIASERVGILELVKNAYDAGATYCKVRIEKVPDLETISETNYLFNEFNGPVIVLEDDGSGMSWNEIENGWLRPASTLKTTIKERIKEESRRAEAKGTLATYEKFIAALKKEHGNRIPLGEKGVGRFATNRLGRNLLIKTKTKDQNFEYILKINWEDFDKVSESALDLESVGISLNRQKPSRDYGQKKSGTQIIIYGGRDEFELTEDEIIEINRTLLKLNSPNPNPDFKIPAFTVSLECPQIPTLAEKQPRRYFDPIFTLTGIVDDWGKLNYDFIFAPPNSVPMPKEEKRDKIQDLRTQFEYKSYWQMPEDPKKLRKPLCGSFYIHLEVWYRRSPWVEGPFADDFIKELDRYGGISVFRDGINVFPAEWGSETDWLELTKAHIKKGSNISYRDMIGNIEIQQSINFNLVDKTNREGVIHNRAYNDFRRLLQGIISLISIEVKGKRDDYNKLTGNIERDLGKLTQASKAASDILERVDENYDVPNDPLGILQRLGEKHEKKANLRNVQRSLKNLEKSLVIINDNQDILTEQAGFGLSMAVVVHEIAKTTSNFFHGITELMRSKTLSKEKLEILKDASLSLQSEIKRISPLRAIKNEPEVEFNISRSIKFCKEVFKPPFEKAGITFSYSTDKDFSIFARYGAINQVLTNLFDNSVYWLSRIENRERNIFVQVNTFNRTLIVADNGDGIHDSILPYLFRPGYSMKWPPSGIGLYVCKYYMQDIKGDIYLTNEKERIPGYAGAQFTLDFSRVKGNEENGD
jgi:signal transduction histidine kinase